MFIVDKKIKEVEKKNMKVNSWK